VKSEIGESRVAWRLARTETLVRTARRFLRRRPQLQPAVARTLRQVEDDPIHPQPHAHALSGPLAGLHAVRVTYSVRLVVRLDAERREVALIDIGDHDHVYP
jgi:mRNA-degrading endonuclease YafQ of YafQ-DinJ toxin-antitoxin module